MFKFSLEPVLDKQKLVEEQIQRDLAAAARKFQEERHRLKEIENEQSRCFAELARRKSKGPSISELMVFMTFIDCLAGRIKIQEKEVENAGAVFNEMRTALVEVFKRRRLLERFKEKSLSDYRKLTAKREEKTMNEIAVQAYSRR
jgi:flagellar protein FliJ